ncbi:MAG: FtsX-like permease family protein [Firmicutes bacterium]|jgi:hypothetical protein|nr:FtsX-like permease family protein [Bacillota bacterium]NBI61771.1 ABC transporter permease [Clostridiales bacterium]
MALSDQYYDQRYLVSGRWIEPNETDVVVIPKSFAPNLEDDLSQWDFKQPYMDGDTLIGKEIVLKFADSNLDGRSPYRGKGTLELFADTLQISGSLIGTFLLLITVIITVSNYTSMIESRKSELGIYEAVGYTKKQIKKNLTIEIILVGLTAFVISIIISGIILKRNLLWIPRND